jgi:hypothetical protein
MYNVEGVTLDGFVIFIKNCLKFHTCAYPVLC